MKYIKLFEMSQKEIHDKFNNEFREFCELNLAYLLDMDGVSLHIISAHSHGFRIKFREATHWSKIKDYFIPFYHFLKAKYYLANGGLVEMDALDSDADRITRYYSIDEDEFRDWLNRSLHHSVRGNINNIVIYEIKILLDKDPSIWKI